MRRPRVLVITSCTGEKRFKPENQLTLVDFRNPAQLLGREVTLANYACSAGKMYTGMQHLRLMEGVQVLRQAQGQDVVDVMILSAGYGLITENREIAPYEVTFNSMKGYEVDAWACSLGVHHAFEQAIQSYDLVFVLLGENYVRALCLPVETRPKQTLVFLASQGSSRSIYGLAAKTFILSLSNSEAKYYRYGLVGLKGFLFKRLAEAAVRKRDLFSLIYKDPEIIQQVIDDETQLELPLGIAKIVVSPKQAKRIREEFIPIPNLPVAPNVHLGMQYYIPEWDDRVDPNYNFLTDSFASENRAPYADDVYAHELFPSPNYDGVLISKVVVDESENRRSRVKAVGVHNFIRFQGKIMGDCGAFGYIQEEIPPYNTDEILEYYEHLGFNYGVSIDHLIAGPFAEPGVREKRYAITLKNAEEFIQKYQQRGYNFIPIGVAQGWSPDSYADAVKEVIRMGYDYIALGGLARAQNREILPILEAIHPHLQSHIRMHLFGVARINSIAAFCHLGVTSCDSASPLRTAWLGATANYHTLSGKMYAAIRVPPVTNNGLRVRRLLEAGVASLETLQQLERGALKALREFDAGKLDLEATLQAALVYDELVELPREGKVDLAAQAKRRQKHEVLYREVLEEKPWKACDCLICQEIGIEVVIFRNNNRNRRRGFHNTYVFYKRFKLSIDRLDVLKPEE